MDVSSRLNCLTSEHNRLLTHGETLKYWIMLSSAAADLGCGWHTYEFCGCVRERVRETPTQCLWELEVGHSAITCFGTIASPKSTGRGFTHPTWQLHLNHMQIQVPCSPVSKDIRGEKKKKIKPMTILYPHIRRQLKNSPDALRQQRQDRDSGASSPWSKWPAFERSLSYFILICGIRSLIFVAVQGWLACIHWKSSQGGDVGRGRVANPVKYVCSELWNFYTQKKKKNLKELFFFFSIRNLCFGQLSCSKYLMGTTVKNLLCCWNLLTCSRKALLMSKHIRRTSLFVAHGVRLVCLSCPVFGSGVEHLHGRQLAVVWPTVWEHGGLLHSRWVYRL